MQSLKHRQVELAGGQRTIHPHTPNESELMNIGMTEEEIKYRDNR